MQPGNADAAAAGSKICIYCGQDCSDRPRVRDRDNRYACRACAAREAKKWESQGPLADHVDASIVLAPEPELKAEVVGVDCPVCLRESRPPETRCERCNYDSKVGLTEETLVGSRALGLEALICAKCKYNLRGLKVMRCPECGEHIRPRAKKENKAGRFKDEATREAYRTPLLMIGIAGGIYLLWAGVQGGAPAVPLVLMGLALQVITGVIAFFACSVVAFGFDAPWHLTILRLTGIYCVVNLASLATTAAFGPSILIYLVVLAVFIQMLMSFLDLDLVQAIGRGVVLFVFRIGLVGGGVVWGVA